jgi:hypothetical protein
MNTRTLLEVAVASAADAEAAAGAGADRLELNAALELGGLTPTPGALAGARRAGLPGVTMLRPRPGGFCYSEAELSVMRRDLEWVGGEVALGILTPASEPVLEVLLDFLAVEPLKEKPARVPEVEEGLAVLLDEVAAVAADLQLHPLDGPGGRFCFGLAP